MTENRFIYLISRELSGDITPEEQHELLNLLQSDSLLRYKSDAFREMKMQGARESQPDTERALQKVLSALHEDDTRRNRISDNRSSNTVLLRFASTAAVLLLLVSGYLFFAKGTNGTDAAAATLPGSSSKLEEKQNNAGMRSSIVLSDGSKIWLNADSRLDYPKIFEGKTREVYLSGEAFFEVTKNPSHPFIIHLDNGTVKVLGTSFNIKAYKDSRTIETSVATGRVAFIPAKKNERVKKDTTFLTRDVKAIYTIATGQISTLATKSDDDKAWTNGKLIFRALTFGQIAIELERAFGKKVVFTDKDVKNYRLTGSFENNSPDEILYYLSLSKPFTYKLSDEDIIISKVGEEK